MNKSLFLISVFSIYACISWHNLNSQELSRAFELRYVSRNPKASGETDFKGKTAVFSTDERIDFLRKYACYAREFFNDPDLKKKVVTDSEVNEFLRQFKFQPLPSVRKRVPLKKWKWTRLQKR